MRFLLNGCIAILLMMILLGITYQIAAYDSFESVPWVEPESFDYCD